MRIIIQMCTKSVETEMALFSVQNACFLQNNHFWQCFILIRQVDFWHGLQTFLNDKLK